MVAVMGWPRTKAEAAEHSHELSKVFGTSEKPPKRRASCPPLLHKHELDELRQYPAGYFSFVLQVYY